MSCYRYGWPNKLPAIVLFVLVLLALFWLSVVVPMARESTYSCKLAVVEWKDAVIYTKQSGQPTNIDLLTADVVSIGCITETEKTILIVHSFTRGLPDDYLAVPKDWVVKIVPLIKKEEK